MYERLSVVKQFPCGVNNNQIDQHASQHSCFTKAALKYIRVLPDTTEEVPDNSDTADSQNKKDRPAYFLVSVSRAMPPAGGYNQLAPSGYFHTRE